MSLSAPEGWLKLLRIARSLIGQVNSERCIIDRWTLGGGTAMMLQLDHRDSRDVDIFLDDPQLLRFLDPKTRDFQFESPLAGTGGDGVSFLKLAFDGLGEIDFIVGPALTSVPTVPILIAGESVLLESIPEIVVKKVHHRGTTIKPRDIFDLAAAGERNSAAIIGALRMYPQDVTGTLAALDRLKPDFVNRAIGELAIREGFRSLAASALTRTGQLLRSAL